MKQPLRFNRSIETSAHYFVDGTTVVHSVANNNIAWHAGNWDINRRSIGIEIAGSTKKCTGKTLENVISLTQSLMRKYSISKDRVIRHYDINDKLCPAYWCGSTAKDKRWKEQFWNKLDNTIDVTTTTASKPTSTKTPVKKDVKPTIEYCVYADGRWLPIVKDLSDYAGIKGKSISAVAVKVSKGNVRYRVHIKDGSWLSWVTGYNLNDYTNGYAGNISGGIKGIDRLELTLK